MIDDIKKKLEKKDAEIATLKNVSKELKIETETLKSEAKQALKIAKAKEKEISKLEVKSENLDHTNKNYKNENEVLVAEKKKAQNEKIKLDKKLSDMLAPKPSLTKSSNTTPSMPISKSTNTASCSSSQSTNTHSLPPPNKSTISSFSSSLDLVASIPSTSTISSSLDPALNPSTSRINYSLSTSSTACQTDLNLEVFSPLPIEMNTKLCYYSPHKKFMSNSLPSLYNVQWTTTDDLLDAAEEALAEQYDREVQEFFRDEQERIKKLKE